MKLLMVVYAIPLLLNVLAIATYRGIYRWLALLILPLIVFIFIVERESASQWGDLTGLLTILISGPLLFVLMLLGIGSVFTNSKLADSGQTGTAVAAQDLDRTRQPSRSRTWRIVSWEFSGGLLAVCGMILLALVGVLFPTSPASIFSELLLNNSARYAIWLIGTVIGVVAGGSLALIAGWRQRP